MSRWGELAVTLEDEITSGRLQPGDFLPSEAQLRERTGYSRTTIRRAYEELAGRGLVGAGPGQRRRVTSRMLLEIHVTRPASRVAGGQSATAGADSWEHDVEALGHEAEELLSVQKGTAGPLAGRLGIEPGSTVIVREMLRLVDGRPHNLARWVFPSWLASSTKLTLPGSIPEGSVPYLAGIGFGPDSYEVQIETRMPDRAEAGVLAIPAGVPVLAEYRTGTAAGRAVFCSVTVWPGDRARLLLDVPVDLPGEGCER